MEDYAYVLDVLPEGRPDSKRRFRREPLVYGLGVEEFKIFDMQPVTDAAINIGDKCYIGKETEERTQIDHVRARVNYSDLTHTAQSELSFVLDEIVKDNEEKFIQFYNHAGPISRRYHSLELILFQLDGCKIQLYLYVQKIPKLPNRNCLKKGPLLSYYQHN